MTFQKERDVLVDAFRRIPYVTKTFRACESFGVVC